MSHKRLQLAVILPLLLALSAVCVSAQTSECSSKSFDIWFNCEVVKVAGARLNQQAPNKQPEAPSIAENSTSLVDQTTAPDLFGIALNLAGLSGDSTDKADKTSLSFTTSAYALYAAVLQHDPLDPAFYTRHPNLRRLYFSVGQETPEDDKATEQDRATLVGFKFLIINRREVSSGTNRSRLERVFNSSEATSQFSRTAHEVQDYLYENVLTKDERARTTPRAFIIDQLDPRNFAGLHGRITQDQFKEIREIIDRRIESRVTLESANMKEIEKIRKAPQLAFTFQTKQRKELGTDEYRAGLAFDYGLHDRVAVTVNGTFDYANSKLIGGDTRGGRVSGETNFKLTRDRNPFGGTGPYLFTVSGEGKWMNNQPSTVTGQLKLTIPIFDGISLPLSVSVANRSELIKEKTVRGRFGFSFDFTKLISRLGN